MEGGATRTSTKSGLRPQSPHRMRSPVVSLMHVVLAQSQKMGTRGSNHAQVPGLVAVGARGIDGDDNDVGEEEEAEEGNNECADVTDVHDGIDAVVLDDLVVRVGERRNNPREETVAAIRGLQVPAEGSS